MNEEHIKLIVNFFGQVIKNTKDCHCIKMQAQYHLGSQEHPGIGWILIVDWLDKKNKHKELSIFLDE